MVETGSGADADAATPRETPAHGGRSVVDPRLVAAGDHTIVAAVVAWGMTHHRGTDALLDAGDLLETVGPFVTGFLAAALVLGAYDPEYLDSPVASLRTVAVVWLAGTAIGLIVRTHPDVTGGTAWPFGLVVAGTVFVGLAAWRLAIDVLRRRRAGSA